MGEYLNFRYLKSLVIPTQILMILNHAKGSSLPVIGPGDRLWQGLLQAGRQAYAKLSDQAVKNV